MDFDLLVPEPDCISVCRRLNGALAGYHYGLSLSQYGLVPSLRRNVSEGGERSGVCGVCRGVLVQRGVQWEETGGVRSGVSHLVSDE